MTAEVKREGENNSVGHVSRPTLPTGMLRRGGQPASNEGKLDSSHILGLSLQVSKCWATSDHDDNTHYSNKHAYTMMDI